MSTFMTWSSLKSPTFPRRRAAFSLVLLLAGGALAQPENDAASKRVLSPAETVAQSRDFMQKMQDTQRRVTLLSDQAKKKKDIIKLNCVNDRLVQVKGH